MTKNKGGRTRIPEELRAAEAKDENIKVRVTKNDKLKIIDAATKCHLSLSEYLLMCHKNSKITIVIKESDPELLTEIKRIGNNINQIAHVLNIHKTEIVAKSMLLLLQGIAKDFEKLSNK